LKRLDCLVSQVILKFGKIDGKKNFSGGNRDENIKRNILKQLFLFVSLKLTLLAWRLRMKVDVKFVNFPVSEKIKSRVAERIEQHMEKFISQPHFARAVFSVAGHQHEVSLSVAGSYTNLTVHAKGEDAGQSLEMAIQKLDAALRKKISKDKGKRQKAFIEGKNIRVLHPLVENAFDKFENEYAEPFELMEIRKAS